MNNINSKNYSTNGTKNHSWKNLGYALMITTLLNLNNPVEAKNYTTIDNHKPNIEVIDTPNIINNIEKRTWVTLPNEYNSKLKTFVESNEVMRSKNWVKFTEDFIVNQMKSDWWIDRQNQLLFIWSAVYEQTTWEYFYDWSDGNDNRLEEFSNVMDKVEKCWKEYVIWINTYMERISAEADRDIMQKDTLWLKEMIDFYSLYIKNPNNIKKEEIERSKELLKRVIPDCKKYWIDYRAILLKEVWDRKKVDEMLRFYGVE